MFEWFKIMTHGAIKFCHVAYKLNLAKINVNQYLLY
jgi:hypothetical protein